MIAMRTKVPGEITYNSKHHAEMSIGGANAVLVSITDYTCLGLSFLISGRSGQRQQNKLEEYQSKLLRFRD